MPVVWQKQTYVHILVLGFYTVQDNSLMRRFGEAWSLHLQSDWIWFRSVLQPNETVSLKTDTYTTEPNYVPLGYPHLRYDDSIHRLRHSVKKHA